MDFFNPPPAFVRIALLIVILQFCNSAYSQSKFEKEIRIPTDSVPIPALTFVNNVPFDKKIRWYKEFSLKESSLEAKTRFRGSKYSIEFDLAGNLQDIEVKRKWNSLPKSVRQKMEHYLNDKFSKYSITKLQYQYSGQTQQLLESLQLSTFNDALTLRYEVVIHAKSEGKFKRFEILFDKQGSFLKSAVILIKNTVNIEF